MSNADMTEAEVRLSDEKLRAEVAKLVAETGHIKMQTLLAPFLAASAVIGATIGLMKLFGL